jgi:hypothetical protein
MAVGGCLQCGQSACQPELRRLTVLSLSEPHWHREGGVWQKTGAGAGLGSRRRLRPAKFPRGDSRRREDSRSREEAGIPAWPFVGGTSSALRVFSPSVLLESATHHELTPDRCPWGPWTAPVPECADPTTVRTIGRSGARKFAHVRAGDTSAHPPGDRCGRCARPMRSTASAEHGVGGAALGARCGAVEAPV